MAKGLGILVWKRCRKVEHQWKENVVSIYLDGSYWSLFR